MTSHRIIQGDCIEGLRTLPDASVHCCVTSPPYWGLRDYGHDGQIGLESTPEAYVARMVEVFREVRRVLRDDGTLWLNLGDTYGSGKQLKGIPWRVAFALQSDGWVLRQDIIWAKPNPMPESVRDRCTKAHEYVFLFAKGERYFYDSAAVREAAIPQKRMGESAIGYATPKHSAGARHTGTGGRRSTLNASTGSHKNRRSVWLVATRQYSGAHFAVMPPDLARWCIKAGCTEGGTVLDPFAGSGTTLAVAAELGRSGIGCELNPEYIELAEQRIAKSKAKMPLFVA
jgi:site-specific DNA-methyltransferase (adenine-specific)